MTKLADAQTAQEAFAPAMSAARRPVVVDLVAVTYLSVEAVTPLVDLVH
ncbi:hypothetical protein [Amycolatopsis balhimycina]|nr:hypothetical protein [Amycolatopsis balhimycina]